MAEGYTECKSGDMAAESFPKTPPRVQVESLDLDDHPYLKRLSKLQQGYPALSFLLERLRNTADEGRRLVNERFATQLGCTPGRCAVLTFDDEGVGCKIFFTADKLQEWLIEHPSHDETLQRRLFILEDLEPKFVDVLGHHLNVDPLVFAEQMNTWNTTSSQSIAHRGLPSLDSPMRSFTLRYYELRTMSDGHCVQILQNQMTYAVNRRRIERWRDVDLPSVLPDNRHFFARRCASFWTSQAGEQDKQWDAVLLVDPPMDHCANCTNIMNTTEREWQQQLQKRDFSQRRRNIRQPYVPTKPSGTCGPACLMLQDPVLYQDRPALWNARNWLKQRDVLEVPHQSRAYHKGCQYLNVPASSEAPAAKVLELMERASDGTRSSILDTLVYCWQDFTDPKSELLKAANKNSVNTSYYLLKIVAQHWTQQLQLIDHGVSNSEWFADDHEASLDSHSSLNEWKDQLLDITDATKDINYMLRQLSNFERAILLNLERLGVQMGSEAVDSSLPIALQDAQKDLLTLSSRLRPFRERVNDLSSLATDLASLRASFKGIQDGELGLRLSLFAVIIFPLTFVASLLSMGDGFRPGGHHFWVFWVISIPLVIIMGCALLFGRRPEIWTRKYVARSVATSLEQRKRKIKSTV